MVYADLLAPFGNNLLLAACAWQRQTFGSGEERDHSSAQRKLGSQSCLERKEVRQAAWGGERKKGGRERDYVRERVRYIRTLHQYKNHKVFYKQRLQSEPTFTHKYTPGDQSAAGAASTFLLSGTWLQGFPPIEPHVHHCDASLRCVTDVC